MSDEIMARKYEFFSWKGFLVGAVAIASFMTAQSMIGFPPIWSENPFSFAVLICFSALVVGIASGGVLVYLFPPDQDVIGIAGLGSDDASQHMSLVLVIVALIQPMFSGFIFFFEYYRNDPFVGIWVLAGFAAPSLGLTVAMFDRTNEIAADLRMYFSYHQRLDLTSLDWLLGVGPRTTTYRMGMLESAAKKVKGLKIRGHEIVEEKDQIAINK